MRWVRIILLMLALVCSEISGRADNDAAEIDVGEILFGGDLLNFYCLVVGDGPDGIEVSQQQVDPLSQRLGGMVARIGGDADIVSLRMLGYIFGEDDSTRINKCFHILTSEEFTISFLL